MIAGKDNGECVEMTGAEIVNMALDSLDRFRESPHDVQTLFENIFAIAAKEGKAIDDLIIQMLRKQNAIIWRGNIE